MLHKHPSAEKAQNYFGISEKVKHDSANFFVYIQPKLGNIYDNSVAKALGENFSSQFIRDRHLSHLSTLLAGGIDHSFIEESHSIWFKYSAQGITTGEYIKLYQLIISYLSGEAHKKHWWRYKKYRDLNRAIRNLLLFDLAIGTSFHEHHSKENKSQHLSPAIPQPTPLITHDLDLQSSIEELNELVQNSYDALHQGYNMIQEILELSLASSQKIMPKENLITPEELIDNSPFKQEALFTADSDIVLFKPATNENKPAFLELVSQTHKKVQKISNLVASTSSSSSLIKKGNLEKMIQEIETDIEKVIKTLPEFDVFGNQKETFSELKSSSELYNLLQKSSETMEIYLNKMAGFKEKKLQLK